MAIEINLSFSAEPEQLSELAKVVARELRTANACLLHCIEGGWDRKGDIARERVKEIRLYQTVLKAVEGAQEKAAAPF